MGHVSIVIHSMCVTVTSGAEIMNAEGLYDINELRFSRPLRLRNLP